MRVGAAAHYTCPYGGVDKGVQHIVFTVQAAIAPVGVAVVIVQAADLYALGHAGQVGLINIGVDVVEAIGSATAGNAEYVFCKNAHINRVGIVGDVDDENTGIVYIFERADEAFVIGHHIGVNGCALFNKQVVADDKFAGAFVEAVTNTRAEAVVAQAGIS